MVFPRDSGLHLHVHSHPGVPEAQKNLVLRYHQPESLPRQCNPERDYRIDYSLPSNATGVKTSVIHSSKGGGSVDFLTGGLWVWERQRRKVSRG